MLDSLPEAEPRLDPEFILFGPDSLLLSNWLLAEPVLPDRLTEEVLVNDLFADLFADLFVVGVDMFYYIRYVPIYACIFIITRE